MVDHAWTWAKENNQIRCSPIHGEEEINVIVEDYFSYSDLQGSGMQQTGAFRVGLILFALEPFASIGITISTLVRGPNKLTMPSGPSRSKTYGLHWSKLRDVEAFFDPFAILPKSRALMKRSFDQIKVLLGVRLPRRPIQNEILKTWAQ